jgi:preprotein translocase subunit SecG
MLSFLLAVHFVLALAIIGLILLQKHDSDGALGAGGGGAAGGMFSVRGQANILTHSTAVLMSIFILNCLVMAKIAKKTPHKESVIDQVAKESIPTDPVPEKTTKNSNDAEPAPAPAIAPDTAPDAAPATAPVAPTTPTEPAPQK